MPAIRYAISPSLDNENLNALFAAAWDRHTDRDFQAVLAHSLLWVAAFSEDQLIGFVNVAWDGGIHAFLLDTTVHPAFQRQGIGVQLVRQASDSAHERGMEWLHVDYEAHLDSFYRACGFQPTLAGLLEL
jgi:GNAT superfamily N-acetyltransferase